MIKKYAVKVPFPDEDSWIFVTRDPTVGDTLEYPGERPLKLWESKEEAREFAAQCNGIIIRMLQRDGWWEQDEPDDE